MDAVLRLPVDETVRVAGSLSAGLICQETAAELRAHGDSAGGRNGAPQFLHATSAVSDIRAIVEWAPQFGQADLSSKRRRQATQR